MIHERRWPHGFRADDLDSLDCATERKPFVVGHQVVTTKSNGSCHVGCIGPTEGPLLVLSFVSMLPRKASGVASKETIYVSP